MADVEFVLNLAGGAEILRDNPLMHADFLTRMNRVKAAAEVDNPEAEFTVVDEITDRRRVRLVDSGPGAIEREAATGRLLRALDSGGGQ